MGAVLSYLAAVSELRSGPPGEEWDCRVRAACRRCAGLGEGAPMEQRRAAGGARLLRGRCQVALCLPRARRRARCRRAGRVPWAGTGARTGPEPQRAARRVVQVVNKDLVSSFSFSCWPQVCLLGRDSEHWQLGPGAAAEGA